MATEGTSSKEISSAPEDNLCGSASSREPCGVEQTPSSKRNSTEVEAMPPTTELCENVTGSYQEKVPSYVKSEPHVEPHDDSHEASLPDHQARQVPSFYGGDQSGDTHAPPNADIIADSEKGESKRAVLSFSDIVGLVESGDPIPGLEQLNIEPTNEMPTQSVIAKGKKPWETE